MVDELRGLGCVTIGLTPASDAPELHEVLERTHGCTIALLVGAEKPGLRPETLASVDWRARIAMAPGVDSFNVGTAVAIALYAWRRAHPLE